MESMGWPPFVILIKSIYHKSPVITIEANVNHFTYVCDNRPDSRRDSRRDIPFPGSSVSSVGELLDILTPNVS